MVLECISFKYDSTNNTNEASSSCRGTYDECGKPVKCSGFEPTSCFAAAIFNETTSKFDILGAGCNPVRTSQPCQRECIAEPKRPTQFCCCTYDLCNKNVKFIQPGPTIWVDNSNNKSTLDHILPIDHDSNGEKHINPPASILSQIYILPLCIVVAVLLFATLIIGRYARKSRRRSKNNNIATYCDQQWTQRNGIDHEMGELRTNHASDVVGAYGETQFHDQHSQNQSHINGQQNHMISVQNNSRHHNNHQNNNNIHRTYDPSQNPRVDPSDIKLLEIVGSGRFGTVHKAEYCMRLTKDSNETETREVAVKVIQSVEQQSWQNELTIYNSFKTKHTNILGFIGSLEFSDRSSFGLVVEYAVNGSLFNYLQNNTVDWHQYLHIASGIAHGLSYLHDADIAHRDFKSKNVLLKVDLTPCITDFGVATILDYAGSQTEQRKKYLQVGTPRYMAPEVLECSVALSSKISFTKIDVYALSLVLWELLSRCHTLPESQDASNDPSLSLLPPQYKMPFEDIVGPNPDINAMRQIVIAEKMRPPMKPGWLVYPVSLICQTILDGWEYDYDARISASCFVERIDGLRQGIAKYA